MIDPKTNAKLSELADYCHRKIPFYRARGIKLFSSFPTTTKSDLVLNAADFISDDYIKYKTRLVGLIRDDENVECEVSNYLLSPFPDVLIEQTTGTTGVPGRFPKTTSERAQLALGIWKVRKQFDPIVSSKSFLPFVHIPLCAQADPRLYSQDPEAIFGVYRDAKSRGMRWLHVQPALINRHISILTSAGFNEMLGIFDVIETTSERLPPADRSRISAFFGSRLFNQYGCIESWALGYDSDGTGNFSLIRDNTFVELVRSGSLEPITTPGEIGDVVITTLKLKLFPIIRYFTGDRAEWIPSEQGLALHLHEDRKQNLLLLNGELVPGSSFVRILMNRALAHSGYLCLDFIQFVQTSVSDVEVRISTSHKSVLFFEKLVSELRDFVSPPTTLKLTLKLISASQVEAVSTTKNSLFRSQIDVSNYPVKRNAES